MPKDTEQELQRLENWLLAEEDNEDTPKEQISAPLNHYDVTAKVYNSDHTDIDPDDLSEAILSPKQSSLIGLVLIFILLCFGILCVFAYWLLRWKGVIG